MFSVNENDLTGRFENSETIRRNGKSNGKISFDDIFCSAECTQLDACNLFFQRLREKGVRCGNPLTKRYNHRFREKPVYIEVRRVVDTPSAYIADQKPLFIFVDLVLFPKVDPRVNDYWSWCAGQIKGMLKTNPSFDSGLRTKGHGMKRGLVRITFFHDYVHDKQYGKFLAHILVNLDSDLEAYKEHKLWIC
jgi:hypothetical protein